MSLSLQPPPDVHKFRRENHSTLKAIPDSDKLSAKGPDANRG